MLVEGAPQPLFQAPRANYLAPHPGPTTRAQLLALQSIDLDPPFACRVLRIAPPSLNGDRGSALEVEGHQVTLT